MIHYFNPGHEMAVHNNTPSYTAPGSMTSLMHELAALPLWYANSDDVVLVDNDFDIEYLKSIRDAISILPKVINYNDLHYYSKSKVCMWGVSPAGIRVFEGLNKNQRLDLSLPNWDDYLVYFNSRRFAYNVLDNLISSHSHFSSISLPTFHTTIESIELQVMNSSTRLLAKSPYSSSGRGLLWLPNGKLTDTEITRLKGILHKQSELSLESIFEKEIDFAMEFIADGKGKVVFSGYSLFSTNTKGAYLGNYLGAQHHIEKLLEKYVDHSILEFTKHKLENILAENCGTIYSGCVGVDMMIYKSGVDVYSVHPCVEINLRYNMGYLAMQLGRNYLSAQSEGNFYLDFNSNGDLFTDHMRKVNQYPLVITDGKIVSGYLSLCPLSENSKYRAYILINCSS